MNTYSQRAQFPTQSEKQLNADIRTERERREQLAQQARAAAAQDRVREGTITRDMCLTATAVRNAEHWWPIIRVNPTSVTVEGPWGGQYRIPFARLREVRS